MRSASPWPISSVQLFSRVRLFEASWTAARQASLSITNSWSPPRCMSIKLVMPSNHLILCCPLLLLPSSIFSSIRVFSNESALCIMWPKYLSFSFNISPSYEHLGLISFRMDWLDLLAVQGTVKSLLQDHRPHLPVPACSFRDCLSTSQSSWAPCHSPSARCCFKGHEDWDHVGLTHRSNSSSPPRA